MNTANIARSLVGGIIKSSDIGLKNHALGLFYAELKHGNSETPTAKQTLKAIVGAAKADNLDSATTSDVREPAPVTIPVAEQIADVGEENVSTSTEVTGSPATEALDAAMNGTTEPQYRALSHYEVIQAGDEWILRDEFRHSRANHRRWREVSDSIGNLVSSYPKSNFRRKV